MKVGILTFPNSVSYGACLQMIALQNTVRRMGHEVEIINYHNPYMKAEKHTDKGRNPLKRAVQRYVRLLLHRRLYRNFRRFEQQYVTYYPVCAFTEVKRLPEIGQRYDAVICGSDQVWSPYITNTDISYFLDFCDETTKRVAYAPSFGVVKFPAGFEERIAPELQKFHALSARELPGKEMVERLTGRETTMVVDPTWLVDAADWVAMEQPHPAATGDYVLYFVVNQSSELLARCKDFAKQHGLKVVIVGGNPITAAKNKDPMLSYALDVGPDQWLYLVHHAQYVFTNSFHGTAFSVLFERNLYVQVPSHNGSRLRQVLESFGMEDREVREGEELTESAVNYERARTTFAQLKEQSLTYLKNALT